MCKNLQYPMNLDENNQKDMDKDINLKVHNGGF